MIGPSSSHTAGAVRLGRTARQLLGHAIVPIHAEITLYGSFAHTYRGHGTDLALIAGLLNYHTDDLRIRDAFRFASEAGMKFEFRTGRLLNAHPNTVRIVVRSHQEELQLIGCSVGGGNIELTNIQQFDVKFTAMHPTLIIFHHDQAGFLAQVTELITEANNNIGFMEVDRKARGGDALTVIELDERIHPALIGQIEDLPKVQSVRHIDLTTGVEQG